MLTAGWGLLTVSRLEQISVPYLAGLGNKLSPYRNRYHLVTLKTFVLAPIRLIKINVIINFR